MADLNTVLSQIRQAFLDSGYEHTNCLVKVDEYRSRQTGQYVYVQKEVGLPGYVQLVFHPDLDPSPLFRLPGVTPHRDRRTHSSNLARFPAKVRKGRKPIHYGNAIRVEPPSGLSTVLAHLQHL